MCGFTQQPNQPLTPQQEATQRLGQLQQWHQQSLQDPQQQVSRHNTNYNPHNTRAHAAQLAFLQQHGINTVDDLRRAASTGAIPMDLAQMLLVQHFGMR